MHGPAAQPLPQTPPELLVGLVGMRAAKLRDHEITTRLEEVEGAVEPACDVFRFHSAKVAQGLRPVTRA